MAREDQYRVNGRFAKRKADDSTGAEAAPPAMEQFLPPPAAATSPSSTSPPPPQPAHTHENVSREGAMARYLATPYPLSEWRMDLVNMRRLEAAQTARVASSENQHSDLDSNQQDLLKQLLRKDHPLQNMIIRDSAYRFSRYYHGPPVQYFVQYPVQPVMQHSVHPPVNQRSKGSKRSTIRHKMRCSSQYSIWSDNSMAELKSNIVLPWP